MSLIPRAEGRGREKPRNAAMRKPKAPEANRAGIVAAAIDEFAARGFKGASMDAIAARTHTTRALINYYFGSKEKLYLAVLEHVYAEIRAGRRPASTWTTSRPWTRCAASSSSPTTTTSSTKASCGWWWPRTRREGRHLRKSKAMRTLNRPIIDRLARVIERGQAQGRFRARRRSGRGPQGHRRARHVQRHQPVHLRRDLPARHGRERRRRAGAASWSPT